MIQCSIRPTNIPITKLESTECERNVSKHYIKKIINFFTYFYMFPSVILVALFGLNMLIFGMYIFFSTTTPAEHITFFKTVQVFYLMNYPLFMM